MINKNTNPIVLVMLATIIFADIFVWYQLFVSREFFGNVPANVAREYFLDVGQGDSELVVFPGNIKVLTDAGPTDAVVGNLQNALPSGDSYIDLAIISQPSLADFNGFNFILDHYRIGAFAYNGRDADADWSAWNELKTKIKAKGIPFITLGRGDKIEIGAARDGAHSELDVLSPNPAFAQSADLADTGLVELLKTPGFRTLLAANIGFNVEDWLMANDTIGAGLHADILKVSDHGSTHASGDEFLSAIDPKVAVIETGGKGAAGIPASSTLARLASSTNALVLRTDRNGRVEIYPQDGKLKIEKEK